MHNIPTYKLTRLAPTPSGLLHLGNIMSFAFTAALAKRANACILLRIDDMDRERVNTQFVQDIFDTLHFLGIPWQEGPRTPGEYERQYAQVHRMDMYGRALEQLREMGKLFACTCTRTDLQGTHGAYPGTCLHRGLPLDTPGTSWRLATDNTKVITKKLWSGELVTATLPPSVQYFMVKRKDGMPGYQLTSMLDDAFFGVDLIVRGEDLWDSSFAQLYLAPIFGHDKFCDTTFYYHPLLIGADGKKLSKTAGSTSVHFLRAQHKTPAEIFSIIAGMMGFEQPVSGWEELVSLAMPGTNP